MENNKKEKTISIGLTEELMTFMDKWQERNIEEKPEKPGLEVKRVIVEIAKKQLEKITKELDKKDIKDSEWHNLMDKVEKISELVRWY